MGTKLYVGNLLQHHGERTAGAFSQAGAVQEVTHAGQVHRQSAALLSSRWARTRTLKTPFRKLNGQAIEGRPLTVNEAVRESTVAQGRRTRRIRRWRWIRRTRAKVASEEATERAR
jgi:hypothetical protein